MHSVRRAELISCGCLRYVSAGKILSVATKDLEKRAVPLPAEIAQIIFKLKLLFLNIFKNFSFIMKKEKFTVREYTKATEICGVSLLDTRRVISSLKEARIRLKLKFEFDNLKHIETGIPEIFY